MGDTRIGVPRCAKHLLRHDVGKDIADARRTALRSCGIKVTTELPVGTMALAKTETAILPDGTIYKLSTGWVPDPFIIVCWTTSTQTGEAD